jgi:hypothetical protein
MLVSYRMHMADQIWCLNSVRSEKNLNSIYFENSSFSIWVPNSEERKSNPKNPYMGVLVRIVESLYSGGSTPVSGSASNSASESESTISPIIDLN